MDKHQIPSTKFQISSNNQIQNFKQERFGHLILVLGICLGFVICDLEFSTPVHQLDQ